MWDFLGALAFVLILVWCVLSMIALLIHMKED